MKIFAAALLLLSSFCAAQALPDAPTPSTTCMEKDGKPCPEWLHKLIGQYPPLPDPPQTTRTVSFFSFNAHSDVTLKPNKKAWAAFIAAHAALGITYAIDHQLTHGVREDAGSEVPAILGISGLDFIVFKCISPAMSIEAPIYGIQHYARDINK